MELGDPLFYAPGDSADVPLAAMRALARRRPAFQPQSEFTLKPTPRQAPPDIPPPPVIMPSGQRQEQQVPEWQGMVANYLKGQQADQNKEDDDLMKRILEAARSSRLPPSERAMRTAPSEADVDEYMRKTGQAESGNNLSAVNPASGATGVYQFLPSTWQGIMKEAPHLGLTPNGMGDRAQQNAAMRYYTDKSRDILKPLLGRNPTAGELYMLHFLGHTGGPQVLRALDRPITETVSKAAMDANPWLYKINTGKDLLSELERRLG